MLSMFIFTWLKNNSTKTACLNEVYTENLSANCRLLYYIKRIQHSIVSLITRTMMLAGNQKFSKTDCLST